MYSDELNSSPLETYRLYREMDTKYKPHGSAADAESAPAASEKDKRSLVQIFLKFNAFICRVDEENDSGVELSFSLYSVQKKKDITECYVVRLTNKLVSIFFFFSRSPSFLSSGVFSCFFFLQMVTNLEKIDLQKTIFANVDVSDTLLVCRVVRVGKISGRQKTAARFGFGRLVFGVALKRSLLCDFLDIGFPLAWLRFL